MGKIFLSYRRGDDSPSAGWLHLLLTDEGAFTPERIFRDVDGIQPGEDFVSVLEAQVDACAVMLCVIGRGWLNALDRLAQPKDYVRIEIAAALAKDKLVIPLLLDQAQMPTAAVLPEDIRPMTHRQAVWLRYDHFKADLRLLVPVLREALDMPPPALPPRPSAASTSQMEQERGWKRFFQVTAEVVQGLAKTLPEQPSGTHAQKTGIEITWVDTTRERFGGYRLVYSITTVLGTHHVGSGLLSWDKPFFFIRLKPGEYKCTVYLDNDWIGHSAGLCIPKGLTGAASTTCSLEQGDIKRYLYEPNEDPINVLCKGKLIPQR